MAAPPLTSLLRPEELEDLVGNSHIFDPATGILHRIYAKSRSDHTNLPSLILYGPPGTGKTSLARLYGEGFAAGAYRTVELREGEGTVSRIDQVLEDVEKRRQARQAAAGLGAREKGAGTGTVLFIDEVHRLSKLQQDRILSAVENDLVTLVGATTESPYRRLTEALRSRCNILQFNKLSPKETLDLLIQSLNRMCAMQEEANARMDAGLPLAQPLPFHLDLEIPALERVNPRAVCLLAHAACGDARAAVNLLQAAVCDGKITEQSARFAAASVRSSVAFAEVANEALSGFIKSIRASDPQAAVFYLAVMLHHGVDPLRIARRLIVSASEDIGLADPTALPLATAAFSATEAIGLPECQIVLAHAAIHLCRAPKSNAACTAIMTAARAVADADEQDCRPPPGYRSDAAGDEYVYPHNSGGYVYDSLLPPKFQGCSFYRELDFDPPAI